LSSLRVRVPRHVARLVIRLVAPLVVDYFGLVVVDYFSYAARPGASARRTTRHAASQSRLLQSHLKVRSARHSKVDF
jgi:hypothetical protein